MSYLKRASATLEQTENVLRGLASEAVSAGDYAAVVQLASCARVVGEIMRALPTRLASEGEGTPETIPNRRGAQRSRGASKGMHDEYPRFYRQADRLVRIAWSKREKAEYEHKAPYAVLVALTQAIRDKGAAGRVFSTDDLLPLRDGDGAVVPSYQAYVGIALFKQTGLLDQHGRQGYSIPQPKEFESAVEAVWRNLPKAPKTRS